MADNFNDSWLPSLMRSGGEKLQNLLGPDMKDLAVYQRIKEEEARLREQLAYKNWFNPGGNPEGNSEVQLYGGQQPRTLGARWPVENRQKMLARMLLENQQPPPPVVP